MKQLERYIAAEAGSTYDTFSFNPDGNYDLTRNFEDFSKDEIIYRKKQIEKVLLSDPDISYLLNKQELKPYIQYKDSDNPSEEEIKRNKEIMDYNLSISESQIFPWLKLNGIQSEIKNYIAFDIFVERESYDNKIFTRKYIIFRIFVQEDEMNTEFGITRADLLSYIIKDLFQRSNITGMHMDLYSNEPMITDKIFYSREMRFVINSPDVIPDHGMLNKYDRFKS